MLTALAEAARKDGISIEEVSVGATPTARFSVAEPGVTELRPGTYVYFDRTQVAFGAARLQDCALTVLATVVSKPARNRIVLDCGSKTLSNDPPHGFLHPSAVAALRQAQGVVSLPNHAPGAPLMGRPMGFGAVFADLDATAIAGDLLIERLSEEHAVVSVSSGSTLLEPGDSGARAAESRLPGVEPRRLRAAD